MLKRKRGREKYDTVSANGLLVFKIDQDDILEMLIENVASKNKISKFNAKAAILGKVDCDLRCVIVIGDEDNEGVNSFDIEREEGKIQFNGDHASTKWMDRSTVLSALRKAKRR